MIATPAQPTFWIDADPVEFQEKFERIGFVFPHRLVNNPLFEIDRLIELSKQLSGEPENLVFHEGPGRIDQRFDEVPVCSRSVDQLIRAIETEGAWILLKHANKLPGYREILDEMMHDIQVLSKRDLSRSMKTKKAIVFMNSPHRTTSYHIDHQSSLLLQIKGRKTISIFDPTDRDVLPESELEKFWTGDDNAAIFKPQFQDRATVIELQPGQGVHIPLNAPHWVQNGPEVSVSLNVNFDYHDRLLADVYRTNYWLRKMGIDPLPPRRSALHDAVKASMFGLARDLRNSVRTKNSLGKR